MTPEPTIQERLLKSLKELLQLIGEGKLIRNTKADHRPGWAIRQIPFVRTLVEAQASVEEAEKKSSEQPKPLCADCGHPIDDSRFHFEAPGTNWGAALHNFLPPTQPQPKD